MATEGGKGRDSTGSSSSLFDLVKSLWSPAPATPSEGEVCCKALLLVCVSLSVFRCECECECVCVSVRVCCG